MMSNREKIEQAKLKVADEALNLEGELRDIAEDLEEISWQPLFKAFKRYRKVMESVLLTTTDYSEADEQTWRKL